MIENAKLITTAFKLTTDVYKTFQEKCQIIELSTQLENIEQKLDSQKVATLNQAFRHLQNFFLAQADSAKTSEIEQARRLFTHICSLSSAEDTHGIPNSYQIVLGYYGNFYAYDLSSEPFLALKHCYECTSRFPREASELNLFPSRLFLLDYSGRIRVLLDEFKRRMDKLEHDFEHDANKKTTFKDNVRRAFTPKFVGLTPAELVLAGIDIYKFKSLWEFKKDVDTKIARVCADLRQESDLRLKILLGYVAQNRSFNNYLEEMLRLNQETFYVWEPSWEPSRGWEAAAWLFHALMGTLEKFEQAQGETKAEEERKSKALESAKQELKDVARSL